MSKFGVYHGKDERFRQEYAAGGVIHAPERQKEPPKGTWQHNEQKTEPQDTEHGIWNSQTESHHNAADDSEMEKKPDYQPESSYKGDEGSPSNDGVIYDQGDTQLQHELYGGHAEADSDNDEDDA